MKPGENATFKERPTLLEPKLHAVFMILNLLSFIRLLSPQD
jgi:hypothetical protein